MATKQFKAESKRLLDLMINSIYTHKEIFLRELISNASDATDKLYYNAMKEGKTGITRDSLPIELTLDKANRRFIIEDHGCGMTAEEMENNLGTIAHSGSLAFKNEMKSKTTSTSSASSALASMRPLWLQSMLRSYPVRQAAMRPTAGSPTVRTATRLHRAKRRKTARRSC